VMNALGDTLVAMSECAPDPSSQQSLLQSALSEGYSAALRIDRRNCDALAGTAEVEMQLGRGKSSGHVLDYHRSLTLLRGISCLPFCLGMGFALEGIRGGGGRALDPSRLHRLSRGGGSGPLPKERPVVRSRPAEPQKAGGFQGPLRRAVQLCVCLLPGGTAPGRVPASPGLRLIWGPLDFLSNTCRPGSFITRFCSWVLKLLYVNFIECVFKDLCTLETAAPPPYVVCRQLRPFCSCCWSRGVSLSKTYWATLICRACTIPRGSSSCSQELILRFE